MEPRQNPSHSLDSRYFQIPQIPTHVPKAINFSNRLLSSPVVFDTASRSIPDAEEPKLQLEHEISMAELTRFAMVCLDQLTLSKKDQPAEQIISRAITDTLPSFTALKDEFLSSRQGHRAHHAWTQQMVNAVEPLLKCVSAPANEQKQLSDLALQCVEKNMQMNSRQQLLKRRIEFLEEAVTQHLSQVGKEIGLPGGLMEKLAKLTKTLMRNYGENPGQ